MRKIRKSHLRGEHFRKEDTRWVSKCLRKGGVCGVTRKVCGSSTSSHALGLRGTCATHHGRCVRSEPAASPKQSGHRHTPHSVPRMRSNTLAQKYCRHSKREKD